MLSAARRALQTAAPRVRSVAASEVARSPPARRSAPPLFSFRCSCCSHTCSRSLFQATQQRGFAAKKKAAGGAVELPVQLFGMQARYANALYLSAAKAGKLDAVEGDLATIDGWLKSTPASSA